MIEILWKIFEVLVSGYEGFNLYFFMFAFLDFNFRPKKNKVIYIIGAFLHTSIVFALNALMFYEGFWSLSYLLFAVVYLSVVLRRNIGRILFSVTLAYVWIAAINTFVTTFVSTVSSTEIIDILSQQGFVRFMVLLTVQVLQTYVYRVMLKLFRKNGIKLQLNEWLLILIVFVLSFSIIMLIHIV